MHDAADLMRGGLEDPFPGGVTAPGLEEDDPVRMTTSEEGHDLSQVES
jgi:hypothetical protein